MKTKQSPGREVEEEFSYSSLEEATVRLDNLKKVKNPTQEVLDEIAAIEELLLEPTDENLRLTKSNMGFSKALILAILIVAGSLLIAVVLQLNKTQTEALRGIESLLGQ
jgi:hypothetical protein